MAMGIKYKYDKYWDNVEEINKLLFVVAIRDPRYKFVIVEFWIRDVLSNDNVD